MWWTLHLDGGPRRVNHASVAIGDKIFSFGGYCSGSGYAAKDDIDIFMLDTVTNRWYEINNSSRNHPSKASNGKLSPTSFSRQQNYQNRNNWQGESSEDESDQNDEHYLHSVSSPSKKTIPFQRYGHTVVGYNGKAYLFGGRSDEHGANSSLHEYDPATLQWKIVEAKGQIPPARDGHTAVMHGHKMYIFGGFEYTHRLYSNAVYEFDFKTLCWTNLTTTGKAPSHRDFHASCIVKEKMYIFGGRGDIHDSPNTASLSAFDTYCDKLYSFDLKTNVWEELETVGDIPSGRRSHSMWEYRGKLYLFGGYDSVNDIHFNDFYSFETETKRWTKLRPDGEHPTPRRRQCSAIVGDKVFIFGGTMPDRARRQGNLCDLADMYVLDYAATLKTLAARKLIQMKTTAPDLPPLGLCLYKEYYYMSQRNIITNDR